MRGEANASKNLNAMQFGILHQLGDEHGVAAEEFFYLLRRAVAAAEPDDFRRRTVEAAAFGEIRILRDDAKAVIFRVLPNAIIRRLIQARGADVGGLGKEIVEPPGQAMAEVLIEEQLHAAEPIKW